MNNPAWRQWKIDDSKKISRWMKRRRNPVRFIGLFGFFGCIFATISTICILVMVFVVEHNKSAVEVAVMLVAVFIYQMIGYGGLGLLTGLIFYSGVAKYKDAWNSGLRPSSWTDADELAHGKDGPP